jgi:ethanolamine-phosphate cytidylyltransferase
MCPPRKSVSLLTLLLDISLLVLQKFNDRRLWGYTVENESMIMTMPQQEGQQSHNPTFISNEALQFHQQPTDNCQQQQEIRIFMEGAFDMMHFGHMNAFRLGRSLGTHLVVGINSDESITECKAPPLMNHQDRLAMVQSCKFVDQVIPCTPYVMNKEYIDWILEAYQIDYIVHGDDPCIVDGKDVYETAKQAGKFRTIPRTDGVSTTDIVGRMLQLTKEQQDLPIVEGELAIADNRSISYLPPNTWLASQSKFLTTTRLLQQFSSSSQSQSLNQRVIYIDGAWDMFHPGHVALLERAKMVRTTMISFGVYVFLTVLLVPA